MIEFYKFLTGYEDKGVFYTHLKLNQLLSAAPTSTPMTSNTITTHSRFCGIGLIGLKRCGTVPNAKQIQMPSQALPPLCDRRRTIIHESLTLGAVPSARGLERGRLKPRLIDLRIAWCRVVTVNLTWIITRSFVRMRLVCHQRYFLGSKYRRPGTDVAWVSGIIKP